VKKFNGPGAMEDLGHHRTRSRVWRCCWRRPEGRLITGTVIPIDGRTDGEVRLDAFNAQSPGPPISRLVRSNRAAQATWQVGRKAEGDSSLYIDVARSRLYGISSTCNGRDEQRRRMPRSFEMRRVPRSPCFVKPSWQQRSLPLPVFCHLTN